MGAATVFPGGSPLPGPWIARLAALLPLAWASRRVPALPVLLLVVLGAACWGGGHRATIAARPAASVPGPGQPSRRNGGVGPALLRVTGYPGAAEDGAWVAPARTLSPGTLPLSRGEGVMVRAEGPPPSPGAVVAARWKLRPPAAPRLPGGFDDRNYLAGRGLAWRAWADTVHVFSEPGPGKFAARVRGVLIERLHQLLPLREAAVAAGVLWGARTPDMRRAARPFSGLGLAHLFAVSGLHVGLVAGLIMLPLRLLGLPPLARSFSLAVALAAYMILTGLPGSVVRAGGALMVAGVAAGAGRRPDGVRILGLLFWANVLWDPARAWDTGARLSYMAAAGILLALRAVPTAGAKPARALATAAVVSLAAQWATLPLTAASFGTLSLLATPANLLGVPLFAAAVWLTAGSLVCSPVWAEGAGILGALAWILLRGLSGLAQSAAGLSQGTVMGLPVPGIAGGAAWIGGTALLAFLLRRRNRVRWLAPVPMALVLLLLGPAARELPPDHAPTVVQFDVGQADCSVLVFPDGWTAMMDTGAPGFGGSGTSAMARDVAPWLRRQGVSRLDAVFLTHGHADHTGGAAALARMFAVGRWWGGGQAGPGLSTGPSPWTMRRAARCTVHQWRQWRLEVVDPGALGALPENENDASLVTSLWCGERAVMVWSGDLELHGEARLLAAELVPACVEVWKAGHHGSRTSGSRAFLDRLRPGLILVSCGVENRHGHPSHGAYTVAGDTVPVLRTDLHGSVLLEWPETGPARATLMRSDLTPPGAISSMRGRQSTTDHAP